MALILTTMLLGRHYLPLLGSLFLSSAFAQNETCTMFAPEYYSQPPWNYTQPFLPYFAPDGTETFDDSDPGGFILYELGSSWRKETDPHAINQTLHATNDPSVTFTFTGSAIEWIGTTGSRHGKAKATLDTDPPTVEEVDGSSHKPYHQQRLWSKLDIPLRKYKLTIQNTGGVTGGDVSTTRSKEQELILLANTSTCLPTDVLAPSTGHLLVVDAFVVTIIPTYVASGGRKGESADGWSLIKNGTSGVAAMQLTMISPTHALIFDRTQHNYASINGHPAWSVLYDLHTHAVRPLDLQSNSFCASGSFLSNGTFLSVGGNLNAVQNTLEDKFHDVDGQTTLRIFEPCLDPSGAPCHILDMVNATNVTRWYPTVLRIEDGSALIIGGSHEYTSDNNRDINEPTVSFFPRHPSSPDRFGVPFFNRTLNANLFAHSFSLPNKRAFIIANTESIILNWGASSGPMEEHSYPLLNGVRVTCPMSGAAPLLPLSSSDNYTSHILLCGGSDASDRLCDYQYSMKHPASQQCSRIDIGRDGSTEGWELDDLMAGGGRTGPDRVLLPTGEVIIVDGARTGYAGIGSVIDPVGLSNSGDPALSPILYSPNKALGERWRALEVQSDIPRLYHSVASLTPNGDIMIAGSNANQDRSLTEYPTEYRVEWLRPPYMNVDRPTYAGLGTNMPYGSKFTLKVTLPPALNTSKIKVSLMDLGYATHATNANSRLVFLDSELSGNRLMITAPPDEGVYPPGPGYVFVVAGGVASKATRALVGDGKPPTPH